ncbi:hypothetical protein EQW78_08305 [Oerskovia turbata]|uniref:Uncharacterized protein n=1 Tax=Oerskovia turbata TaxID=1713 RepID=A0A4Q1KXE7_9CELL|nr:DUF6882 domain-containing protein [Oerskovia turbata]RXR26812.1 hypothetical protein EQW73_04810 [Oerskovia turbata]RXR34545.1 hypothetical protein EQW78_08305 [Oerskovia turbata]TGJ97819.1 hypothetical protein DLJ96_07905 [Actinotalea fermentans ATCC 43279 = JCM 9966 = DSM 3133]TGJ97822.1 hypothetical protein DLJ96_07920 [Actinotalea fermentans ATCC 43279 = JCM 9966 = DSM 3133]
MSQTNPAPTLQDLVDRAVILSAEHQAHFADLGGESAWDADLEAGTVTFHSEIPLVCGAHFLGTAAPETQSWLWGWHNVNHFSEGVVAAAEHVHQRGVTGGIFELSTPEILLTDAVPYRLALAAKAVTGHFTHFAGPTGGGTCAWFLVTHPRFELPPATVARVVRVVPEGIGSTVVADHRRAVRAYAVLRGLDLRWQDEQTALLGVSDGEVTVSFDERGRLRDVSGSLAGAPEPVPAPPPAPARPERRGWFGRKK